MLFLIDHSALLMKVSLDYLQAYCMFAEVHEGGACLWPMFLDDAWTLVRLANQPMFCCSWLQAGRQQEAAPITEAEVLDGIEWDQQRKCWIASPVVNNKVTFPLDLMGYAMQCDACCMHKCKALLLC